MKSLTPLYVTQNLACLNYCSSLVVLCEKLENCYCVTGFEL